jgi:hypothetical protein
MRYTVLVFDQDRSWQDFYRRTATTEDFNVVAVDSPTSAIEYLLNYHPHVFILGGSSKKIHEILESLPSFIRNQVQIAVISSADSKEEIKQILQFKLNNYILKSTPLEDIERRLIAFYKKVKEPHEPISEQSESLPLASILIQANIVGISETGLCIESQITTTSSSSAFECSNNPFLSIGLPKPYLKLINSEYQTVLENACNRNVNRNFFQIQGWNESERKHLRMWLTQKKLPFLQVKEV